MKKKILFTGVTGHIGRQLVRRLVLLGHEVYCIVRGKDALDAQRRLREVLGNELDGSCFAILGDIDFEHCALSSETIEMLKWKIDCVVHLAARTKFSELVTFVNNIWGLCNLLNLCSMLEVKELFFVSTGFVAGTGHVLLEGDARTLFQSGKLFEGRPRNPYEESKRMCEQKVIEFGLREGVSVSIMRPTIVGGDALTGKTTAFTTGLLGYFYNLSKVKHELLKQLATDEGKKILEDAGIFLTADGRLYLPIVINRDDRSTLNVVASDWCVELMSHIISQPANGKIYNLANPNPSKVAEVIDWTLMAMGISGVQMDTRRLMEARRQSQESGEEQAHPILQQIQNAIDASAGIFEEYVHHEAKIETGEAALDLGSLFKEHPQTDKEFFARQIGYALSVRFGKLLEVNTHETKKSEQENAAVAAV